MKEKNIPSSEEMKKAEEIMTEKQAEMSKEREATFEAGANTGHKEILELSKDEFGQRKDDEKFADKIGLTGEFRKLYIEGKFGDARHGIICPRPGITEEQILEFIEKMPEVNEYEASFNIISEKIIQKLVSKFPRVWFKYFGNFGSKREYWRNKVKEIGGRLDSY